MRCPTEGRFVSYDTEVEPELLEEKVSEDGSTFSATVRRVLACAECSEELKDAELELEQVDLQFTHEVDSGEGKLQVEGHHPDCWFALAELAEGELDERILAEGLQPWSERDAPDFDIEVSYTPSEDVERTDRHGKPITNPRYQTTLYGVEATGTVTCQGCGAVADIECSEYEAASSFNELV